MDMKPQKYCVYVGQRDFLDWRHFQTGELTDAMVGSGALGWKVYDADPDYDLLKNGLYVNPLDVTLVSIVEQSLYHVDFGFNHDLHLLACEIVARSARGKPV
ncbi:MAG: hypothetical protein AAGE89_00595 [Pseudomonadota bacterium]